MTNYLSKIFALKNKKPLYSNHLNTILSFKDDGGTPAQGTLIKMIGGKSIIFNQQIENGNFTSTTGWSGTTCAFSVNSNNLGIATVNGAGNGKRIAHSVSVNSGHKYYYSIQVYPPAQISFSVAFGTTRLTAVDVSSGAWTKIENIWTAGSNYSDIRYYFDRGDVLPKTQKVYFSWAQLIDLTQMFGAGNEPTTVADFKVMFPNSYYDYSTGSLLSGKCDSVISYNSSSTQIDEYTIPAEIQALEGYGLSTRSLYNYIDFVEKKFVAQVASRTYQSGDESDSTVLTDGTNTIYPVTTPIETNISSYISNTPGIQTASGGSIELHQQNDTKLVLPNTIE